MDLQQAFIAGITALATLAASWGVIRSEVNGMKEALKELRDAHETLKDSAMHRTDCDRQHARTDREFSELRQDVKEIKRMLQDWMMQFKPRDK